MAKSPTRVEVEVLQGKFRGMRFSTITDFVVHMRECGVNTGISIENCLVQMTQLKRGTIRKAFGVYTRDYFRFSDYY
jgi:hypothetical protein